MIGKHRLPPAHVDDSCQAQGEQVGQNLVLAAMGNLPYWQGHGIAERQTIETELKAPQKSDTFPTGLPSHYTMNHEKFSCGVVLHGPAAFQAGIIFLESLKDSVIMRSNDHDLHDLRSRKLSLLRIHLHVKLCNDL